ncbi:hypothetical protein [Stygiolobus caldivivus]|uniref:Uncharacterized protein n=1 Tax=Stygiolobus caldivivus TaxID=2824673 RepID=A0A8D5U6M6_9CREN|nr:hypothetical protein [Stygiolobus caldivivus]BCU70278.1 hypothetical protein KN1_15750 [Stygiolobus caldivivus]
MSQAKKFLILQDLILARTAMEKVSLHLSNRQEAVFPWVERELKEFIRRYSTDRELSTYALSIKEAIERKDTDSLRKNVNEAKEKLNKMIDEMYKSLAQGQ